MNIDNLLQDTKIENVEELRTIIEDLGLKRVFKL